MRHLEHTGSKRLAALALLAAILTIAVALGGLARGNHAAKSQPARVAANWTDFSFGGLA
jgi:hypothetical protein